MTARHPKRLSGYFYLAKCDPGRCCNVAQILAASPLHTPPPPSLRRCLLVELGRDSGVVRGDKRCIMGDVVQ